MKLHSRIKTILLVCAIGLGVFVGQQMLSLLVPLAFMGAIRSSHIDGNLPDEANFEKFLKRDLTAYFVQQGGKNVTVDCTPLRNGPTQSGMSYPKFYLWVRVFQNKKQWQTGAARGAAIDKKEFEVTSFLPLATLRSDRAAIYQTFPRPIGDKIVTDYLKP